MDQANTFGFIWYLKWIDHANPGKHVIRALPFVYMAQNLKIPHIAYVYPDSFVPEKISGYLRFPYLWNMNYLHLLFMLNVEHVYVTCICNKQLLIKIFK